MNKLKNDYNRGFSLKNDDLRFVDASVRLALADTVSGLCNGDTCIIWGCVCTPDDLVYKVSAGAIFYSDEIWHVPAHEVVRTNLNSDPPDWAFVVSYDSAGIKLDKDLASHNTYELRSAIGYISAESEPPSGTIHATPFDEMPKLRDMLLEINSIGGSIVYYPNDEITGSVTIRKSAGIVTMRGALSKTLEPTTYCHLFTIASGWVCGEKIAGHALGEYVTDGTLKIVEWYITTDGKFYAKLPVGSATVGVKTYVNVTYHI